MDCISAEIEETKIKKVCNDILNDDIKDSGYKVSRNHKIQLIPSFNSTISTDLPRIGDSGFKIDVSGFKYYPSSEKPMKIMLDLSNDSLMQLWQDELVDQIGKKSIHEEIEPPSIELISAGKIGQERHFNINSNIRDDLVDKCENYSYPKSIKIKSVNREILD